ILMNAVDSVLQDVRDRLPSSDAKHGPLSDLTRSGKMLVRTFAGRASDSRNWLARSIERTFAGARPGLYPGGSRTHGLHGPQYSGGGSYSGPLVGNLNVDARPTSPISGALAMSARPLAEQALREAGIQMRMRGKR